MKVKGYLFLAMLPGCLHLSIYTCDGILDIVNICMHLQVTKYNVLCSILTLNINISVHTLCFYVLFDYIVVIMQHINN